MVMQAGGREYTLAALVAKLGGELYGDGGTRIVRLATLQAAGPGDITFLANPKYRQHLANTRASAVILAADALPDGFATAAVLTPKPYAYYARVAALLDPFEPPAPGIAATAVVESALPASCSVGHHAVIGPDVVLGEGVVVGAGAVLGAGVVVGVGSFIHPGVVVYPGCQLGNNVIIHSGAVIGADGFGFAPDEGRWLKIPQLGRVVIGNDVEIGANTTIDRGALGDTVIEAGCKIDNQVQIGHNCHIGQHTVIAGCVGIAGSTRIGHHCALGGAAMILGHLEIAAGTEISPGTMVMKSLPQRGKYTALYPLDTHDRWMKGAVQLRQLEALAKRVRELEKKLDMQDQRD